METRPHRGRQPRHTARRLRALTLQLVNNPIACPAVRPSVRPSVRNTLQTPRVLLGTRRPPKRPNRSLHPSPGICQAEGSAGHCRRAEGQPECGAFLGVRRSGSQGTLRPKGPSEVSFLSRALPPPCSSLSFSGVGL